MTLEERVNLASAFLCQKGADRVDQLAAGLYRGRAEVEQPRLRRDQPRKPLRSEPPAPFRIAPPGAAARARRIDQHHVRLPRPVAQLLGLVGRIQQAGLDARASAFGARLEFG